jgi:hypothetical protein
VDNFPVDLARLAVGIDKKKVAGLAGQLMKSIQKNSEHRSMTFRHDRLKVQTIYPKHSKSVIDQIDAALAEHYGFSDCEVDFLVNYDVKYRMGREQENNGEE